MRDYRREKEQGDLLGLADAAYLVWDPKAIGQNGVAHRQDTYPLFGKEGSYTVVPTINKDDSQLMKQKKGMIQRVQNTINNRNIANPHNIVKTPTEYMKELMDDGITNIDDFNNWYIDLYKDSKPVQRIMARVLTMGKPEEERNNLVQKFQSEEGRQDYYNALKQVFGGVYKPELHNAEGEKIDIGGELTTQSLRQFMAKSYQQFDPTKDEHKLGDMITSAASLPLKKGTSLLCFLETDRFIKT